MANITTQIKKLTKIANVNQKNQSIKRLHNPIFIPEMFVIWL